MCLLYKYNEIWKLCSESSRYTAIFYNDLFLLRTQNLADTSFIVRKSVLRWCYFSICYDRDSELKQGLLNRFIKMFIKLRLIPQRNKSESGPNIFYTVNSVESFWPQGVVSALLFYQSLRPFRVVVLTPRVVLTLI